MAFPQDNSSSAESRSFLAAGQYQESDSGRPDSATPRASFHALFDQRSVSDATAVNDGGAAGRVRSWSPIFGLRFSFDRYPPDSHDGTVPGDWPGPIPSTLSGDAPLLFDIPSPQPIIDLNRYPNVSSPMDRQIRAVSADMAQQEDIASRGRMVRRGRRAEPPKVILSERAMLAQTMTYSDIPGLYERLTSARIVKTFVQHAGGFKLESSRIRSDDGGDGFAVLVASPNEHSDLETDLAIPTRKLRVLMDDAIE
ncbi:hypothetical protein OH77DRAFT_834935 [Trametes cingulata]|nr:hypothetical protein OH77DRAFT_834935 [Trametes cingulata]